MENELSFHLGLFYVKAGLSHITQFILISFMVCPTCCAYEHKCKLCRDILFSSLVFE